MSEDACRSPVGLDCCSCCLDLASGSDYPGTPAGARGGPPGSGPPGSPLSPSVSHFRQLREQLVYENLNADKLRSIMRQDSLEAVVRDPCFLLNEGICNRNIDQTLLSILLFFHSRLASDFSLKLTLTTPQSHKAVSDVLLMNPTISRGLASGNTRSRCILFIGNSRNDRALLGNCNSGAGTSDEMFVVIQS
ncbi:unnamed protein product [Arctogadus glacialis]